MNDSSYRKALDDLKTERDQLITDRDQIDRRIAQVDGAIANLRVVLNESDAFEGKLADACRQVLMSAPGRVMLPTEVRDSVKTLGYDTTQHTNLMASIHSVLKRLAEGDDVKKKPLSEGMGYYWARNYAFVPARTLSQSANDATLSSLEHHLKAFTNSMNSPAVQTMLKDAESVANRLKADMENATAALRPTLEALGVTLKPTSLVTVTDDLELELLGRGGKLRKK